MLRRVCTPSLIRFLATGVLGFLIDLALSLGLTQILGVAASLARYPAFLVASLATYWLNRYWTFSGTDDRSLLVGWARYAAATSIGVLVNYAAYLTVLSALGSGMLGVAVAVSAGSLVGLIFNFLVARLWVFRTDPIAGKRRA